MSACQIKVIYFIIVVFFCRAKECWEMFTSSLSFWASAEREVGYLLPAQTL
jgi:hypothetical protein